MSNMIAIATVSICFAQVVADPISGGAGWLGAGLLGLVLAWLLLKHLPDKDKQINSMITDKDKQLREMIVSHTEERLAIIQRYDEERFTEREARHKRASEFQIILNNMAISHEKAMRDFQSQHKDDAQEDRQAFMSRNTPLLDAIKGQTTELRLALVETVKGLCRWNDHNKTT